MPTCNTEHLTHPKYRPDIDGLRAIAILSVVGYHAFPFWVKGGFIGVDIFFVISGFLISTIIFGSLERNSFSFVEFYIRRINRIFPALLLVLIACYIFGWFALLPDEYKQLGKHIAGGSGFISNYLLWNESGYFDNIAETKPLQHLWSLGIEEQFYIVWPPLLWFAWKRRLNFLAIAITVGVISFALNVIKVHGDTISAFYSPQTRFWELMAGSVLAYMTQHKQNNFPKSKLWLETRLGKIIYAQAKEANVKTLRNVQSMFGAVLIIIGVLVITKERLFPGWWAVLPTVGAVLIISAGAQAWLNRVVLSSRVLVWFGLISFPLYLWHWPLLSFARIIEIETPSREMRIAVVVTAIAFAWLTYRLIEIPIRFGGHRKAKTITLIALMVAVGCVGYNCFERDGLAFRSKVSNKNMAQLDWGKNEKNEFCRQSYPEFGGFYCIKAKAAAPTILLLGDSHANALYPGVAEVIADTPDNLLNLGERACLPFFDVASYQKGTQDVCAVIMNRALKVAEEQASLRTVVMTLRGPLYLTGKGYGGEPGHDNRGIHLTNRPEIADVHLVIATAMKTTIARLLAKNKQIVFVLDVPELGFDPKSCLESRPLLRLTKVKVRSPCAVSRRDFDKRNQEYRELVLSVLKDFPTVHIFDAAASLCDTQWCWAMKDGKMLYRDGDHLSVQGSLYISKKLVKSLRSEQKWLY